MTRSQVDAAAEAEVEDLLAAPLQGPCARVIEYLDIIDKRAGTAKRMDFIRIAGSETAVNRWVKVLVGQKIVVEILEPDGSRVYRKTEFGERCHRMLRDHRVIKFVVMWLSKGPAERLPRSPPPIPHSAMSSSTYFRKYGGGVVSDGKWRVASFSSSSSYFSLMANA